MEKKKLAIFVNSLGRGGAEKTVFLLTHLLAPDFDIHLLVFDKDTVEFELPPTVKLVSIGRFTNPSKATLFFHIFSYVAAIKKYLNTHQIPVLLSFLSKPGLIAGMLKWRGWDGKLIICERTMTHSYLSNHGLITWAQRFLIKKLYGKAELIITNSVYIKNDLQKKFGLTIPIINIYNSVDLTEATDTTGRPLDLADTKGCFLFCNVGRCDFSKNQPLLLRAFAKVNSNCRLVIIGKDAPQKLMPLCLQLGITHKVQLLDVRLNIYPYLQAAHAFVLSSAVEGFPNVVLEAMACSLPIVSTDCQSGPREILAPGTTYPSSLDVIEEAPYGLLCKTNDADMLAQAMEKMAENSLLRQYYAQQSLIRAKQFKVADFEAAFRNALAPFYPNTKA